MLWTQFLCTGLAATREWAFARYCPRAGPALGHRRPKARFREETRPLQSAWSERCAERVLVRESGGILNKALAPRPLPLVPLCHPASWALRVSRPPPTPSATTSAWYQITETRGETSRPSGRVSETGASETSTVPGSFGRSGARWGPEAVHCQSTHGRGRGSSGGAEGKLSV